ncbi:hypothetical protein I314_02243 [Cryptococcus bacillisporus CA1873]|uniref:Uncharacterized protein n=1 Tax=Cryptococcus bacillisporus CA1873 TaxID=1296111 RepID=A0ABR5BF64_CRYGA|nr:hypothetical protein I314_02243 [Cryptococcus bacillisporus CA1873]|eukprot:KIR67826.1 hypothetical protein I314_02243 [Cryptococcus gattii CA1873]
MTSMIHLQSFDGGLIQGGLHTSPAASPRSGRPRSQSSLHIVPQSTYSPPLPTQLPHPISAYPVQAYRLYPQGGSLQLRNPVNSTYPSTAPALPFYPAGPMSMYDSRGWQPMIRTISHAHPMNSATEQTVSSQYSSSPHSAHDHLADVPPITEGGQPNPWGHSAFHIQTEDGRSINPSIFGPGGDYSMSRSTSGASDSEHNTARLLTPSLDYRSDRRSPHEVDLRNVIDSLGDKKHLSQVAFTPHFDLQSHSLGLGPHPQPEDMFFGNRGYSNAAFNLSSERGAGEDTDLTGETEYERERAEQIMNNRKLLEDVGLGGHSLSFGSSHMSGTKGSNNSKKSRKVSTSVKKRIQLEGSVRASPRIRSMGRSISYANLDGGSGSDNDEYLSEQDPQEEEFRPFKRSRGQMGFRQKSSSYTQSSNKAPSKPQLSLWGLLQVYPEIPHLFPLFYYTLDNDLTINSESVPLIGSIPSNCTPMVKAETLQAYFHRGRRVLSQVDAFTSRCDRKYDGLEIRWPELDYHTRIAIRDVRRKVVERCENYKYTRRDILDKHVGKGQWQPIEQGMIEWRVGMAANDPANDLANVTLTLPTPPPNAYVHQIRQQTTPFLYHDRVYKPFPQGRRTNSAVPRTVSVIMAEPDEQAHFSYSPTANSAIEFYGYAPQQTPIPPMYGEDQVPMSVQMPDSVIAEPTGDSLDETSKEANASCGESRRLKRAREDDQVEVSPENDG